MKSLADRIEALYSVFGDVPKRRSIEGCTCCLDKEEIGIMLSKPLRELTGGELARYSASAFLTVGTEADYLYFLPRILEIGFADSGWWPDIEVTGRAIGETKPDEWPARRREALVEVLHAALREAIGEEDGWRIDQLVCGICKMGLEVMPFLEQIEGSPRGLVSYYERNSEQLQKGKLGNAFWDRELPGFAAVVAWFGSERVEKIIWEAYGGGE